MVKHELQLDTAAAKISALKVKSVFAANTAQADAAEANTQRMKAEEVYMKTVEVVPELNSIKKYAQDMDASANEAMQEAEASAKRIEGDLKDVEEKSKLLAVQREKALLKEKFKDLSDWREKVLRNPWEQGQVAAAKAAAPYFKSMGSFAGSMASYGLEAGAMRSQSAADAQNAKALAAGVDAKQEAGDVISAEQDREMAKALQTQSKQLADRAVTLDGAVTDMNNVVPQYAQAAQMASWNAEFQANPDGVPPPPVDPNFAFASPEKLKEE